MGILQAELERPKYSREDIVEWISRFKYGDPNNKEYQRKIIDIFLNSIYVFDDRLVFTYNYKNGAQTVTLADVSAAFGSDLKFCTPPAASCRSQDAHLIVMGCAVFAPASEADVFCQRIPGCAWTHIAFQVRPFLLPVCSHSKTGIFLSMHPN